jgi:hypothetical protein
MGLTTDSIASANSTPSSLEDGMHLSPSGMLQLLLIEDQSRIDAARQARILMLLPAEVLRGSGEILRGTAEGAWHGTFGLAMEFQRQGRDITLQSISAARNHAAQALHDARGAIHDAADLPAPALRAGPLRQMGQAGGRQGASMLLLKTGSSGEPAVGVIPEIASSPLPAAPVSSTPALAQDPSLNDPILLAILNDMSASADYQEARKFTARPDLQLPLIDALNAGEGPLPSPEDIAASRAARVEAIHASLPALEAHFEAAKDAGLDDAAERAAQALALLRSYLRFFEECRQAALATQPA